MNYREYTGKIAILALLAQSMVGCSTISTIPTKDLASQKIDPAKQNLTGIFYYLPKGRIRIKGDDKGVITIASDIVPDTSRRFYYRPNRNYLYDDLTDVKVTAGLLNTGNSTATDQTGQILGNLVADAAMIAKSTGGQPEILPFDIVFDPECQNEESPISLGHATTILQTTQQLSLTCTPLGDAENEPPLRVIDKSVDGLVYRVPKAYRVRVVGGRVVMDQTVLLPDVKRSYVLDYSRMPFVTKVTNATFSDGMLVEINQSVPSPILGFLSIPKAILQSLIPMFAPPAPAPVSGNAGAKPAASTPAAAAAK